MKFFLSIILLFVSSIVHAQTTFQLEGTIGKSPVYMSLSVYPPSGTDSETSIMGSYYYKKSLKDIFLGGRIENNEYLLSVEDELDKIAESFRLVKKGDSFTGTWTNKNGKTLSVNLKPISTIQGNYQYDNIDIMRFLKANNLYDYVRLSNIKLQRDTVDSIGDKSFVWFSEVHCQAPFFRLGNGFTDKQRQIVNPILDKIHLHNILDQLQCTTRWYYNNDGVGIDYNVSVNYIDDNLLGFQIFASYYCGGAHPDFGGVGYLLDLKSGASYSLSDVYDLTPATISKLLTDRYHFEKPIDEDDDPCDYTDLSVWEFYSWSVNKEGISFTPSFPRVYRSCEDSFLLPYSDLKPYIKKSFPYELNKIKE